MDEDKVTTLSKTNNPIKTATKNTTTAPTGNKGFNPTVVVLSLVGIFAGFSGLILIFFKFVKGYRRKRATQQTTNATNNTQMPTVSERSTALANSKEASINEDIEAVAVKTLEDQV